MNRLLCVASRWTIINTATIVVYRTIKRQSYVNEYETFRHI